MRSVAKPRFRLRQHLIGASVALLVLAVPTVASAELEAVEVTLYMPCSEETAAKAIEALGAMPGVARVDAAVGSLLIRIHLAEDFRGDPLSLVQLLWEMKIFPNRIYLEGTGRLDGPRGLEVAGQEIEYALEPGLDDPAVGAEIWFRAEVTDWIEDQPANPAASYTVRLVQHRR